MQYTPGQRTFLSKPQLNISQLYDYIPAPKSSQMALVDAKKRRKEEYQCAVKCTVLVPPKSLSEDSSIAQMHNL